MAFKAINLLVSYSYTNITKLDAEEVPMEFPDEMDLDSACDSIDEISKEEIESFQNNIKSKLTDTDYETYVQQFWVGLL